MPYVRSHCHEVVQCPNCMLKKTSSPRITLSRITKVSGDTCMVGVSPVFMQSKRDWIKKQVYQFGSQQLLWCKTHKTTPQQVINMPFIKEHVQSALVCSSCTHAIARLRRILSRPTSFLELACENMEPVQRSPYVSVPRARGWNSALHFASLTNSTTEVVWLSCHSSNSQQVKICHSEKPVQ